MVQAGKLQSIEEALALRRQPARVLQRRRRRGLRRAGPIPTAAPPERPMLAAPAQATSGDLRVEDSTRCSPKRNRSTWPTPWSIPTSPNPAAELIVTAPKMYGMYLKEAAFERGGAAPHRQVDENHHQDRRRRFNARCAAARGSLKTKSPRGRLPIPKSSASRKCSRTARCVPSEI